MTPTTPTSNYLCLSDITVGYGGRTVVEGLNLEMASGEIACLLGPSGCGKSTILRAIAGLEPLMSGRISLDGRLFSSKGLTLPAERRNVGMVFQDLALFPHFTVAENIAFALRGWSASEKRQRVDELLRLVGLSGVQDRYPHSLSGGQQQRIALVRAIGPRPKLLLLDEPFSGLDASLRESLVMEVRSLLLQEKMTALLVTHDQAEAFSTADKVAIMERGRLIQCGHPQAIYHEPAERFVAEFIGVGDFLSGTVAHNAHVQTDLGLLTSPKLADFEVGQSVSILVRPGDVIQDESSTIRAEIIEKQFRGSHFLCRIRLSNGEELNYLDATHEDHKLGTQIGIQLNLGNMVVFAAQ